MLLYIVDYVIWTNQLYRSSSSFWDDCCICPLFDDGHFIAFGFEPPFPDLLANPGSNFLLNCSYFSKSRLVTDLLAVAIASSKCFLVISGTGSKFWAFPPFSIRAFILVSASIALNKTIAYISHSCFCCFLANFSQISTWKSICDLSNEVYIDIFCNWCFSKVCF